MSEGRHCYKTEPVFKGINSYSASTKCWPLEIQNQSWQRSLKKKKKTEIPSLLLMRNILISICCRIIDLKNNVGAKKNTCKPPVTWRLSTHQFWIKAWHHLMLHQIIFIEFWSVFFGRFSDVFSSDAPPSSIPLNHIISLNCVYFSPSLQMKFLVENWRVWHSIKPIVKGTTFGFLILLLFWCSCQRFFSLRQYCSYCPVLVVCSLSSLLFLKACPDAKSFRTGQYIDKVVWVWCLTLVLQAYRIWHLPLFTRWHRSQTACLP